MRQDGEDAGVGLVGAVAAVIVEEAAALEHAAGAVAALLRGCNERDLVVALQHFDRLKQAFDGLGGALAVHAQAMTRGEDTAALQREIVAAIPVAAVRQRVSQHLAGAAAREAALIGIDVEF